MSEDPDPSQPGFRSPDPGRPDPGRPDHGRIDVEIAVEDQAWHDAVPDLATLVERVSQTALAHREALARLGEAAELSVLLTHDQQVRDLNRRYRARDGATNVLSFAYGETDPPTCPAGSCLGDVVLARETVAREAAAQGKPVRDHLSHLLVHGILHLCGFDHETEDEAEEMERLEREILAGMGIADPYRPVSAGDRVA